MDKFNHTGLGPTDHLMVLDIDNPGADGLFNVHPMRPTGYSGVNGDGSLRLHGFDVELVGADTLRFFLVNHRVPIGKDAAKFGANSTVEVFEAKRGATEMKFVRTVYDPAVIQTPNKVAATGDGSFVVTNDHTRKSE